MKRLFSLLLTIVLLFSFCGCTNEEINQQKNLNNVKIKYDYCTHIVNSSNEYTIINHVLYGRGYNSNNILGEEVTEYSEQWIKIADNVIHICANYTNLIYLTETEQLFGIGKNNSVLQESGRNKNDNPKLLMENCSYATMGNDFVLAIDNEHNLLFWGQSNHGQAKEITENIYAPKTIANNIKYAYAFGFTSAWITDKNELYLCGDNSYGQIGNGHEGSWYPSLHKDIVTEPYKTLDNCFKIEIINKVIIEDSIVLATLNNGEQYIWGQYHNAYPTKTEDYYPEYTSLEYYGHQVKRIENSKEMDGLIFHFEKDNYEHESIIAKSTKNDSVKKTIKSNITPPFEAFLTDNKIIISCINDNCVYQVEYEKDKEGKLSNINNTLLYNNYAIPIYVKDLTHIVFAVPDNHNEIVYDITSHKTVTSGHFDSRQIVGVIDENEVEYIVLNELKKGNYDLTNELSSTSTIEKELVYKPSLNSYCNKKSYLLSNYFDNSVTWCWEARIKEQNMSIVLLIDAYQGIVYCVDIY